VRWMLKGRNGGSELTERWLGIVCGVLGEDLTPEESMVIHILDLISATETD
jgi:hypothetical protein